MQKDEADALRNRFSQKSTDDLLAIWTENNRQEWRDDAFEAIKRILNDRNVALPRQTISSDILLAQAGEIEATHKEEHMEQKHSGIGIASFIISIVVGMLVFLVFVVAGVMATLTPGGMDNKSAGAVIVGLFMIALLIADLVALGLGIAGLRQKDRKKIFAILGTIFSSVTLGGTILLVIIGNLVQ